MTATAADLNVALLHDIAAVAAALGHPTRLNIANLLAQAEKPVDWLADQAGESLANTSAHLRVLAAAGLVSSERRGRHVFYRLASDRVLHVLVAVRNAAEAVSPAVRETARALTADLPEIAGSGESLMNQVRRGRFALLDLRPPDEYAAGHMPGARSFPFDSLDAQLEALPRTRPLAAYCRGPYCAMAVDGVRRLRGRSLNALRVPFGMAEWRAAGLPVEIGATSRRPNGGRG